MSIVLKVVNSAFYGYMRQITSLKHATVILGFNTVKSLALGASVFKTKPGEGGKHRFDRNKLWTHSLGTGTASKILARKTGYTDAEEAFVSGLLHDVGKVIFDSFFNEEFQDVIANVREKNMSMSASEKEVMDMNHAEAGRFLLSKWHLPPPVVNAVGFHHDIDGAPAEYAKLASIVHIANVICRKLKIGSGGDDIVPKLSLKALKTVDATSEILEEVEEETNANREIIELFDVL